jgi:hypothetical protein
MEQVASSPTAEQIVSALSAVAATHHGQVQSQQQRGRGSSRAGDALRTCIAATCSSTDAGSAAFWLSFVTSGGLDALFSALSRLPSDDKPRAVEAAARLALASQVNGAAETAVRDWVPRAPQDLTEAYLEVQLQHAASVGESLFAEGRGKARVRCKNSNFGRCALTNPVAGNAEKSMVAQLLLSGLNRCMLKQGVRFSSV